MTELLGALDQSALAGALRAGRWTYPLVNAGHIFGIALLFGAIIPLDLRLLGLWRSVPLPLLSRVLVPVAACGMALALATGPLLFIVDPLRYAGLPLFYWKLALIALALVNVAALRAGAVGQRLAGLLSALLWAAVIVCGRLIAYV